MNANKLHLHCFCNRLEPKLVSYKRICLEVKVYSKKYYLNVNN